MADEDFQEFPKMLYRMGKGNVLQNMVVNSKEEQQEAGKDWKESIPKPRGRPAVETESEAEDE